MVFFTFCFLLAPVLHSLLSSVSTDSIYAMCTFFLLVYWTCFDYKTHWKGHPRKPGSNTISLSSALLAALCLASRLPDPYHTFALLSTAVTLLALWPALTRRFRVSTVTLVSNDCYCLYCVFSMFFISMQMLIG